MDETFDDFLHTTAALTNREGPFALATLVSAAGSGKALGRRAWFLPEGEVRGAVTLGGCADGRLRHEAAQLLACPTGHPARLLNLDLGSDEAYEFGMTCGGRVEVLLQLASPDAQVWRAATRAREAGKAVALLTTFDGETRLLAGETARPAGVERRPDGLYEYWPAPLSLLLVGSGPVARPLSGLARTLGLRVTLTDDHPARATPELFPDVHTFLTVPNGQELALPPLDTLSAVVVVSHDYAQELSVLGRVLPSPVPYVALLASRRRGAAVLDFMAQTGVPAEQLARVRTPAGVDLGLSSPAGIALSILSELAQVIGGGSGQPLGTAFSKENAPRTEAEDGAKG